MSYVRSDLPAGESARYWSLNVYFKHLRQQLRSVSYEQAEADCVSLADRLLAAYSRQELAGFSFLPIPRGGLIVLGLLAYVLDLAPEQLPPSPAPADRPLCIVDDCSLTGLRLHQALAATANEHVVFAHLYSPPALREAILTAEARVRHCLAAQDLAELSGGESRVDDRSWGQYLGDGRYWAGAVQPIVFPWSEPDKLIRDPFTGAVEGKWRFASPDRSLRNRAELGLPPRPVDGQAWRVPDAVVAGWFDGVLWLLQTATGETYRLQGTAAVVWRALASYGSRTAALAEANAMLTEGPLAEAEFDAITAELVAHQLLETMG